MSLEQNDTHQTEAFLEVFVENTHIIPDFIQVERIQRLTATLSCINNHNIHSNLERLQAFRDRWQIIDQEIYALSMTVDELNFTSPENKECNHLVRDGNIAQDEIE